MTKFHGHLALIQRVIPAYRAEFFDLLANSCEGGLALLAGLPLSVEAIPVAEHLQSARLHLTHNRYFRDPQSKLFLCWQTGLIPWLAAANPDALIVEANPRYFSTWAAIRWMKAKNRPVLGWGLGAPRGGNPIDRMFRRSFLQSLDGVIAYSRRGAAEYRALGLKNVDVAHNAVAARPNITPPERAAAFTGQPAVLFVGRLQARKRLDILFKACAALPLELQPKLLIVGDGPDRVEFETLARQIYPAAQFLGAKHGFELTPFFYAADLFALPGTGGLAAQQAMAHGLPLIVAKGDGTQDDLVRPANGWQVPPGDQAAFSQALKDALSDAARLRAMGSESFRIVSQEINLENMVQAFVGALKAQKSR